MQLQRAQRKDVKIKIGIQGPSGSGKTKSALLVAFGLTADWSKIAVIDTENRSSELYSNLGAFNVLPLFSPFTPERFNVAIQTCMNAGMQVVIIDSISAEWQNILQDHAKLAGNSYTNWSKFTPRHQTFVETLVQSDVHVICTLRSKQAYVLIEKNGKQVPEKIGMKPVQRDDLDYELTLVFQLSMKHAATAIKDRTEIFADKPEFLLTSETGFLIKKWCEQDVTVETQIISQIEECADIPSLKMIFEKHPLYQKSLLQNFNSRRQQLTSEHGNANN